LCRLQRQRAGSDVHHLAAVGGERDRRRVTVDELRNSETGGGKSGEQLTIREQVRGGAFGGEFVECATSPLRDRPDRGVVQVDGIGRPREFRRAQRLERLAQRTYVGRVIGDFRH